mmetsp:Transcript_123579/g.320964  ORF Transcript_123579/g.320964 Transcript_123579/m.320964 type:complete len:216 (+) Transcript_123579:484-1131(+)
MLATLGTAVKASVHMSRGLQKSVGGVAPTGPSGARLLLNRMIAMQATRIGSLAGPRARRTIAARRPAGVATPSIAALASPMQRTGGRLRRRLGVARTSSKDAPQPQVFHSIALQATPTGSLAGPLGRRLTAACTNRKHAILGIALMDLQIGRTRGAQRSKDGVARTRIRAARVQPPVSRMIAIMASQIGRMGGRKPRKGTVVNIRAKPVTSTIAI